jgi:hypothetical protein
MSQPAALADWITPQPLALPDLGPGVEAPLREQLETALRQIAADPSVKALVLFGSRANGSAHPSWSRRPRWPAGGATSSRCNPCPCRWIWW